MQTLRMARLAALAALLGPLLGPGTAVAQTCPPNEASFATWTWLPGDQSGDDWMRDVVCASPQARDAIVSHVVTHMGLDSNWDDWDDILATVNQCNPNSWGLRAITGGYAADYVGVQRDNDTLGHGASPGGTLPDGTPIRFWLSQYVSFYVSEEGFVPRCLASGDAAGPADGWTFASNPWDNGANSLFYPWFWNLDVGERAGTLVHEATHEFQGHVGNDKCSNGGSCDDVFMNANAQSFNIIYDLQALDAYQREDGGRALKVVGYGNEVCGYLPALPDQVRFGLVQTIQYKFGNVFQFAPPMSSWPAGAFIDPVSDAIYDVASEPGGGAGLAYRIDMVNGAMWPCEAVCNVADYTFDPNGASGPRACNEDWQPENAVRNAANRQRCEALNAQVAAGVTPAERAILRSQATNTMQGCIPGLSDEYIARMCQQASVGATHVDDIDAAWPIAESLNYMYDDEQAVRSCQAEFCQGQPLGAWNEEAFAACFEWDDDAGCMSLACGDLDALEAKFGRDSLQYLNALVCRASELGRNIESLEDAVGICDTAFNECYIRENYLPLWLNQLNEGGDCWAEGVQNPADPLQKNRRLQIGLMPADRYVISDANIGLLQSTCLLEQMECEAFQAALQAMAAKVANMKAELRPAWKGPPLPDPWEGLRGRFDRELVSEMAALGGELIAGMDAQTPISRNERLMNAVNRPEARLATAEFLGRDVYLAAGGARFAEGVFAPEALATFTGPDAALDPYGLDTVGLEAEIGALTTLNQRVGGRAWQALTASVGRLGGAAYYGHLLALLGARDAAEVLAAHDALQADLQALGR
jgi:hypothetical protein